MRSSTKVGNDAEASIGVRLTQWSGIALLGLLLVLQIACSATASSNSGKIKSGPAVPVKAARVITKEMPVEISAIGNIQPVSSVAVRSQITGTMLKVNFAEGAMVKKGQSLFTLDSRPFMQALKEAQAALAQSNAGYRVAQANLANARAQLSAARSNVLNQRAGVSSAEGNLDSLKAESDDALVLLKQQETLASEGVVAQRDLQVAQAAYKSALAKYQQGQAQVNQAQVVASSASGSGIEQAQAGIKQMEAQAQVAQAQITQSQAAVDNAKIQLTYCQINAPIDGRAGSLIVTQGNLITANDSTPLVSINSVSPIYATFTVPERYLQQIQKYDALGVIKVTAQIDAENRRTGNLTSLDNQVDQATGTVSLKASFVNDDQLLYAGRFVTIVLTLTDQPDAIVIPAQALQTSQQGQFVYVIKADQTAEMRKVTLDRTVGDEAVIADGLQPGESVVTDGQLRLSPGSKVQITPDDPAGKKPPADQGNPGTPGTSEGGQR
jgi:multidrug efflux system membrane fusion protein